MKAKKEKIENPLQFTTGFTSVKPLKILDTGFPSLNALLKIGGLPAGHYINIWGTKGSAKSTLARILVAQAQRQDPRPVLFISSEFDVNPEFFRDAQVDESRLEILQATDIEGIFDLLIAKVKTGNYSMFVLDSIGGVIPPNAKMPGDKAKRLKAELLELSTAVYDNDVWAIFTNHVTMKIGVLYGSPEDYPGGEGYKHLCKISIRINKRATIPEKIEDGVQVGISISARIDRSKFGPEISLPYNNPLNIYFKDSVDSSAKYGLYDEAVRLGLIVSSGPITTIIDHENEIIDKFKGRAIAQKAVVDDPKIRARLEEAVKIMRNNQPTTNASSYLLEDTEEDEEIDTTTEAEG